MDEYLPRPEDIPDSEISVDEVLSCVFAPPFQMTGRVAQQTTFQPALRRALSDIHSKNSANPIKFPSSRRSIPWNTTC